MKKVISVVGARPNFMKVAPLQKVFKEHSGEVHHLICHTGQHYDANLSRVFFEELELPKPDFFLGVGSGSHAEQTARIMVEFEKVLTVEEPNLVIVVGDVNSTIACSLVAAKLGIKIAHVEAGLRSFDRSMPEEINRLLTDAIADILLVSEKSGLENLEREGVPEARVFHVGNVMIDSLVYYLPKAEKSPILSQHGLSRGDYVVVTLHRPSNVDSPESLKGIIGLLNTLSKRKKLIFPVHPRTRANLHKYGLDALMSPAIKLTDPIGYIDFLALISNAAMILTDSGGIQEETTYLGIQCVTLRDTTERPSTVEEGTNHLVGTNLHHAEEVATQVIEGKMSKHGRVPRYWDGMAAGRIVGVLRTQLSLW